MKKALTILLAAVMAIALLTGCVNNKPEAEKETPAEKTTVRIGALTGPTVIGLVKMMDDAEKQESALDCEFTVSGSADEISPKLIQGQLDIALIPANLASVLYKNTTGGVKVLAINTLGVVYIVEKGETLSSLADLKGKTVYATGKGAVPEYALRYVLSQNGINPDTDVNIEWKSEPAEIVSLLKTNESGIAMLPQPYVTSAAAQVEGLETAFDLTAEWDKLDTDSRLITGVVVARTEFIEKNPEAIEEFLTEYSASIAYVKANVADAAQMLEAHELFKAAIMEKAIPYCNLEYIDGDAMKTAISEYLKTVFAQNENAVGGELPDDEFYYKK